MELMLAAANLVVSAWEAQRMVGVARSLTDWTYVTYLSDVAGRDSHQRTGIGRADRAHAPGMRAGHAPRAAGRACGRRLLRAPRLRAAPVRVDAARHGATPGGRLSPSRPLTSARNRPRCRGFAAASSDVWTN